MLYVALAGVSGALVVLSFPPYSLTVLILVALVPLLVAVSDGRSGWALGWVTGLVVHLGAFTWVLPTIARFEHVPIILALPFHILFVVYQALPCACFAAGVTWTAGQPVGSRHPSPPVLAAAWWVLLEWGFPTILPWSIGDALATSPLLRQAADLLGVFGLSFFIVCVNACMARAVSPRRVAPARRLGSLCAAAVLVTLVAAYGVMRLRDAARGQQDSEVDVTIIQGGLRSGRDDLDAANEAAWSTYAGLSEGVGASAVGDGHEVRSDLLVWPETVLRVYLQQDAAYRQRVAALVQRLERPLVVGALDLPAGGPGELNSAYLIQPFRETVDAATQTQIYHKTILLPFGEYVPGARWLPLLSHWRTTGEFVRGDARRVFNVVLSREESTAPEHDSRARLTQFAPSICFEAVRPGAFNEMVRAGAQFLVNLTDDGWFADSAAADQHLNAVILRAVETRRWLVRASNSGVSAFIDPTGTIVTALPLGAVGVLSHTVTGSTALSLYVRFGNWPVVVAALIVFVRVLVVVAAGAIGAAKTAS